LRSIERSVPWTWEAGVWDKRLSDFPLFDVAARTDGSDWPLMALTMIGQKRLNNIWNLLLAVELESVPGDFMECGVWRGGGSIFAAAVIKAYRLKRDVWLADSFSGLPLPRHPNITGDTDLWAAKSYVSVNESDVRKNMEAHGLLDDRIHFCSGFFVDSLPNCHPNQIAVLRMDGDMYESTMDQLFNLYSLVSVGGYVIVDDWTVSECNRAIKDFWKWHEIIVEPISIDKFAVYWKKNEQIEIKKEIYEPLKASKNLK